MMRTMKMKIKMVGLTKKKMGKSRVLESQNNLESLQFSAVVVKIEISMCFQKGRNNWKEQKR